MKAIIGLGNPEVKYRLTRHNTGFLVMDEILKAKNITLCDKFNSFFAKENDILYLLPKTYMNLSGRAVIELMNFYKLTNKDILVIYDDATIDLGIIRMRSKGSFGGHNGIKSIINCIGTNAFDRLKIGVGPIGNIPIDNYVLSNFSKEELEKILKIGKAAINLVDYWVKEGFEKTQTKFNGRIL